MPQIVKAIISGKIRTRILPDSSMRLIDNVNWGRFDEIFSPAFWATQVWFISETRHPAELHRLGNSLVEEIAACLLGGYGMRSEVGLAAFQAIRNSGMLYYTPTESDLYKLLSQPFNINGRTLRYRYPKQRSLYLSQALRRLSQEIAPINDDLKFRSWLLTFHGIGLKTASWITRNWLSSDRVAILDIHIYRAGILAGIFQISDSPRRCYLSLEHRFIQFAKALDVRLSLLDAVIWSQMRQMKNYALDIMRSRIKSQTKGGKLCQEEIA